MSNYTQTTFFGPKDALTTGDPLKVIKGSEHDTEYGAISTAIATKFDGVVSNAGLAFTGTNLELDFSALLVVAAADPSADRFAVYDSSVSGMFYTSFDTFATASAQCTPESLTLTAGVGLSGGGDLSANRTFTVDLNELTTETAIASTDFIAMVDVTDSGSGKITLANLANQLEIEMNHDSMTGFVANEHINHGSITLTAGTGLSGGGTIAASRTFNLDITGLSSMTVAPAGTDEFLYLDGTTHKTMSYNQVAMPSRNVSTSGNFASTDVGEIVYWTGTSGTLTMPTGVGQDDCFIIVVNSGSGTLTIAGSGVAVNSANNLLDIPSGGMACLIRETSGVWFLGGSLE